MDTIGKRIQKYRKEKGLTQEELAGIMEVSPQAVSKWETDASCPDMGLVPKLCRTLGMSADELICGHVKEVRVADAAEQKPLEELTLRIRVRSAKGDKVRVNLPMTLVKIGMEVGLDVVPMMAGDKLMNLNMEKMVEMVEHGLRGKLVEVESADGDIVEVVVE